MHLFCCLRKLHTLTEVSIISFNFMKCDNAHLPAAARATEMVYGSPPDYTREGGSIPITTAFEESTKMNVCLLPVGACDDMAHR